MSPGQCSRCARFALRMAHRGKPRLPRKSRRLVADAVKAILRDIKRELADVGDWDGYEERDGVLTNTPVIVGDVVLEFEETFNPYYHEDGRCEGGRSYRNWLWREKWWGRVECCIRAGFDLAVRPSAGVLGFDICDLRRMYRGNIPAWINNGEWVNSAGERDIPDLNKGECAISIWL